MILYLHRLLARVAQLVERQPSKLNVASSNLVFRSKKTETSKFRFFLCQLFFNLSPKVNSKTMGTPNNMTSNLLVINKEGCSKRVIKNPPIAPPK